MRILGKVSNSTSVLERPARQPIKDIDDTPQTEEQHDINLYLRPAIAEDLLLMNTWFQNPLINRYSGEMQLRKSWKQTMDWWRALGDKTILSIVTIVEKTDPMSFYCGRSIGYVQWDYIDKEYPLLNITIGDCGVWGRKIGTKTIGLASEQIMKLKKVGKFYCIVHNEDKIGMHIIRKYEGLGVIQKAEPIGNGYSRAVGDCGCLCKILE